MKKTKLITGFLTVLVCFALAGVVAFAEVSTGNSDVNTRVMPGLNYEKTRIMPGLLTGDNNEKTRIMPGLTSSSVVMPPIIGITGGQPHLTIGGEKNAVELVSGKVQSVSGQSLTVSMFGLNFSVLAVASSTRIMGVADIAHIGVGDTVSVRGNIDTITGVITAIDIRDLTQGQSNIDAIKKQIEQLMQQLRALQGQTGQKND